MTVGAIVPVRGWAPFLAETLDGLLAQEPPLDAIVVVDDASPEPVRLGAEHESRCRVLRLPARRGLAGARAAGLELLETELVALCDGDDTWEPGSLAPRVAALSDGGATASFGHALIVGPDNRPTGETWDELAAGIHDSNALLPRLYESNPLCVSSAVLRRDALLAAGLDCDLARAEDWDLWLRLIAGGAAFAFEPRAVVRYRRRAGGLSGDIATLAAAQLALHERHAGLVDSETRARVRAADLRALGAGLVRERRYAEARRTLRAAAQLAPRPAGERALAASLAVPGLRRLRGRRDPYRR